MREDLGCALDGKAFLGLDPRLYIEDLEESVKVAAETAAGLDGTALLGEPVRESLTVTLTFLVKERDPGRRSEILSRVNGWAQKGWLTMSSRPWQRLYVVCVHPAEGRAKPWHSTAQLVWTAFERPYWTDEEPVRAVVTGASAMARMLPRGTRRCPLEAEIENESGGTVNSLTLAANGRTVAFSGLNLGAGETLRLYYDKRGLLHAETDQGGKLDCRTAESDDGIWLEPGRMNTVQVNAEGVCRTLLYARGEYD